MLEELDFMPRTVGRPGKAVEADYVRDLGPSDLALLNEPRQSAPARTLAKLRDRHHALARCLAQGMSQTEASAVTGYDPSRISILLKDPTFNELLSHYRDVKDSSFAEFTDRAGNLALTAVNELADRLEDDPDKFSNGQLLEVAKFGADRTGHAPIQKVQQTNVNFDLGGKMQAARQRLALSLPPPPVEEFHEAEFTVVEGVDDGRNSG